MSNLKRILENKTHFDQRVISDAKSLDKIISRLKKDGHKIVLTQGVYDLIHEGHALYLENARSHGDILVVGVDSDELTKKRKGPNRPIVPQAERLKMLVHLRHVDLVILRNVEDDIGDLIRLVKPDVLVVSTSTGDFSDKQVKDYNDFCGQIITLPPQAATSTSARIRLLAIDGAEKLAREINKLTKDFISNIRKS